MTTFRFSAWLMAGVAGAALAAPIAVQAQAADASVSALVRQAAFWRERGRADLAQQVLERALLADPRNADVLAALAANAAEDGDAAGAQRWTARLRQVAPNDPRLQAPPRAAAAGRPASASTLSDARRLAQAGDAAGAVAAYRRAFGGDMPPAANAREYYETLAGVPSGRAQAIAGLRGLLRARPNDVGLQFALARAQTYGESTRREGVAQLSALARGSGPVAAQAAEAWRQALVWLSANPADAPLYEAYLSARGPDPEISAKLAQAQRPAQTARATADPFAEQRRQGFAALEAGDSTTAEARFQAVLAQRPRDADALGGLGLVRLRAEQFSEAQDLLSRASAAAPAAQARWRDALASARFFAGLRQAQAALEDGDFARARTLAQGLTAPKAEDQALAAMVVADSYRRQADWSQAETAYRQALQSAPQDEALQLGLMEALLAQPDPARQAEGQNLAQAMAAAGVPPERLNQALARPEHERGKALAAQGDVVGAAAAFQSALALQPDAAWVRYDYARFLAAQGQSLAADNLMAGARAQGDPDSLYATALYLDQTGRGAEAQALMAQTPPASRTAEMSRFVKTLEQRVAIDQLVRSARSGAAYTAVPALRAYAGQPDLPMSQRAAIALALYDVGDEAYALSLAQTALLAPPEADASAYDGFVKVLARAGRDVEAAGLIRRVAAVLPATPEARRDLAALGAGLGVERAERLRRFGDHAGAFDALSQAYALAPQDAQILNALGQLYQDGRLYDRAQQTFQAVLLQKPDDPVALNGMAEAALAQNDAATARATVRRALSRTPDNVDLHLLLARVEQSAGDRKAALRALETARTLRERQMAASAPLGLPAASGGLGPNPFMRPFAAATGATAWAAPAPALDLPPAPMQLALGAALPWGAAAAGPLATSPAADASWLAAPQTPVQAPVQTPAPASANPWADPMAAAQQVSPWAAPLQAAPAAAFNPFAPVQAAPAAPAQTRRAAAGDPVLGAIDRQIADLSRRAAPEIHGEVTLRARSGEGGLSQLNQLGARASISTPVIGSGRLALVMEPVTLDAGSAGPDARMRYGANPIPAGSAIVAEGEPDLIDIGPQTASGAAVSVTYTSGAAALDLGVTPLGFRKVEPVGGLRWTPRLAEGLEGRIWAERRAVTDSLTAYAGSKDAVTGIDWGRVRRTGGGLGLVYDQGRAGVYGDVSAYRYEGEHTASNESYQVNLGAYIRPYRTEEGELQVGLNLNHQGYDNNQNRFTLGHGGYFSPQAFTSLALPVTLRGARGPWNLELSATPGYETYRENAAPVFPNRPDLQGQLEYLAGESQDVAAFYPSRSQSGFGFAAGAKLEYDVTRSATLGVDAGFSGFGDYDETRAAIYLRQKLGRGDVQ